MALAEKDRASLAPLVPFDLVFAIAPARPLPQWGRSSLPDRIFFTLSHRILLRLHPAVEPVDTFRQHVQHALA